MFSMIDRGLYAYQLAAWLQEFKPKQLLILRSEDLYELTKDTVANIAMHLQIPAFSFNSFKAYNFGQGNNKIAQSDVSDLKDRRAASMDKESNRTLQEIYKDHNSVLQNLLRTHGFSWDGWE